MFIKGIQDIFLEDNVIGVKRTLNITCALAEEQIRMLMYSGQNLLKDEKVENSELPPFILSFYYYVFQKNKIPTEKELLALYFAQNKFHINGELLIVNNETLKLKGVEARLLRSYPSIIRDFHFYLLLKESGKFQEVKYSLFHDYCKGLDLMIKYQNKDFYISTYIGSLRSKFFKEKKYSRHSYKSTHEIHVEADFMTMERFGNIYLFGNNHLEKVINYLNRIK